MAFRPVPPCEGCENLVEANGEQRRAVELLLMAEEMQFHKQAHRSPACEGAMTWGNA